METLAPPERRRRSAQRGAAVLADAASTQARAALGIEPAFLSQRQALRLGGSAALRAAGALPAAAVGAERAGRTVGRARRLTRPSAGRARARAGATVAIDRARRSAGATRPGAQVAAVRNARSAAPATALRAALLAGGLARHVLVALALAVRARARATLGGAGAVLPLLEASPRRARATDAGEGAAIARSPAGRTLGAAVVEAGPRRGARGGLAEAAAAVGPGGAGHARSDGQSRPRAQLERHPHRAVATQVVGDADTSAPERHHRPGLTAGACRRVEPGRWRALAELHVLAAAGDGKGADERQHCEVPHNSPVLMRRASVGSMARKVRTGTASTR